MITLMPPNFLVQVGDTEIMCSLETTAYEEEARLIAEKDEAEKEILKQGLIKDDLEL